MLTQAQIDQFHADGFLVIRKLFSGDELRDLRKASDGVVAEGMAQQGADHIYHTFKDGTKRYYRSEKMWNRGDIFKAVTVQPEMLAAIGQCTGEPFLPINDSFVCKTPRSEVPINWHQDPPLGDPKWVTTHAAVNFDTDIYLDHSTVANGCVWGIPGHHLVGHVDINKYTQEQLFEECGAVPIEMEPGDVLFHCLSSPHGSIGNTTDTTRRIFYVHYMSKSVLEDCYGAWMTGPKMERGFKDSGFDLVEDMSAARQRLGLPNDLAAAGMRYERGVGYSFTGTPNTPFRHWGALINQMSPAELAAKKALTWNRQLAGTNA